MTCFIEHKLPSASCDRRTVPRAWSPEWGWQSTTVRESPLDTNLFELDTIFEVLSNVFIKFSCTSGPFCAERVLAQIRRDSEASNSCASGWIETISELLSTVAGGTFPDLASSLEDLKMFEVFSSPKK